MSAHRWTYDHEGMGFRQDEFSWQGSSQNDERFFLRRSKDRPNTLSDILFGALQDNEAVMLVVGFLNQSGGIESGKLVCTGVAGQEDPRDQVVERFDQVRRVMVEALEHMGCRVTNSYLDPDRASWNAVFEVQVANIELEQNN